MIVKTAFAKLFNNTIIPFCSSSLRNNPKQHTLFLAQLHKLLDFNELREFATLLKLYREDLKVNDFLKKLQDLYGEQRKFLIPGGYLDT